MRKKFRDPETRNRAAALAKMIVTAKPSPTESELTFAIWCALEDARTAGFSAGCAFARSRNR